MPNNVLCSFARALLAFTHVSCYNHAYDKERKRGRERKKKERKGVERKKKERKKTCSVVVHVTRPALTCSTHTIYLKQNSKSSGGGLQSLFNPASIGRLQRSKSCSFQTNKRLFC